MPVGLVSRTRPETYTLYFGSPLKVFSVTESLTAVDSIYLGSLVAERVP